jgi:DNA-binding NarL/FixJ family response regulator
VGDDPLARSGLAALLEGEPGLDLVETDPDVILWDSGARPSAALELPGTTGTPDEAEDEEEEDEEDETGPPVLALAADEETAAEALAAGARGVLFRDVGVARLTAALQAVARGLYVMDDGLAALLQPPPSGSAPSDIGTDTAEPVEPLTPREVEVLQLLAQGLSNKQIGARLGISEHTAKFHVNAILGKLGAHGRTNAVVRAARLGLFLL